MTKHWWLVGLGLLLLTALVVRVWQLGSLPPSLYWEEAAIGYDAYSILQTRRDHHGNFLPVAAVESFGDWKPALYVYAIIPFLLVFDLSAWAVRMPSVVSGMAIVAFIGWLVWQMSCGNKLKTLLAVGLAALNPWLFFISRVGFEVNLSVALIIIGVAAGWCGLEKYRRDTTGWWSLLLSAVCLVLSMYAYHAARLIAPLLGLGVFVHWLVVVFHHLGLWSLKGSVFSVQGFISLLSVVVTHQSKLIVASLRWLTIGGVVLVLLTPLIVHLANPFSRTRLSQTSILTDLSYLETSNQARELAGDTVLARIFFHRYWYLGGEILANYFSYFTLDFLFVSGDENLRHGSGFFGHFYYWDLLPLLVGVVVLSRSKYRWWLAWWLVVGLLPAALTKTNPHALRALVVAPVFIIAVTEGWWRLVRFVQSLGLSKFAPTLLLATVIAGYGFFSAWYWRHYTKIYPQQTASEWQVGSQQVIELLAARPELQHQPTLWSRWQGRPAMFYWFYTQTDPNSVQQAAQSVPMDQGEFLAFQSIQFGTDFDNLEPGQVLVVSDQEWQELTQRYSQDLQLIDQTSPNNHGRYWVLGSYDLD